MRRASKPRRWGYSGVLTQGRRNVCNAITSSSAYTTPDIGPDRSCALNGRFEGRWCACRGQRVIYTTPLKALSNQKLVEMRARFGAERVGLQTGDTSLDVQSDIVIMTTEILRNILYRTERPESGEGGQGPGQGDDESAAGPLWLVRQLSARPLRAAGLNEASQATREQGILEALDLLFPVRCRGGRSGGAGGRAAEGCEPGGVG